MTMGKEIEELKGKLEKAEKQLVEVKAHRDEGVTIIQQKDKDIAALTTAHKDALAARDAEHERKKIEFIAKTKKDNEERDKKIVGFDNMLKAEQEKTAKIQKDLDDAKHQLAHPAYAHAGGEGTDNLPDVSASGGDDEGLLAQYHAITDPAKKTLFWREHSSELLAEDQAAKEKAVNSRQ